MKWTKTLLKTTKENIKDEQSKNAQLLLRAGYIDKSMAGVYTYLPFGRIVIKKITALLRESLEELDAIEVSMPALHAKDAYLPTERWDSMDSLIRFTTYGTGAEYALGATHEEICTILMKKFIQSYKDLPYSIFQIQTKFRDEKRAKGGLLRGREFLMKDMYSFHENKQKFDAYYEQVRKSYAKFFTKVGIAEKTYYTYASGGDYSKYSNEFQTLCASGEDTIFICSSCDAAINKEIYSSSSKCPECKHTKFREEKSIEVANIFKLGTRFSEAFGLTFLDKNGEKKMVQMGCYGIGVSRMIGTIVELFADTKGLIWPKVIAPFSVHIVAMNNSLEDSNAAEQLYLNLKEDNIDVFFDDRTSVSFGQKLADADLLGIPIQILASQRAFSSGIFELKIRATGETIFVSKDDLHEKIHAL